MTGWVSFDWRASANGQSAVIDTVDHLWAVLYYPGEGWGIQRDRVHPHTFYKSQPECKMVVEKEILSGVDPGYNRDTRP